MVVKWPIMEYYYAYKARNSTRSAEFVSYSSKSLNTNYICNFSVLGEVFS